MTQVSGVSGTGVHSWTRDPAPLPALLPWTNIILGCPTALQLLCPSSPNSGRVSSSGSSTHKPERSDSLALIGLSWVMCSSLNQSQHPGIGSAPGHVLHPSLGWGWDPNFCGTRGSEAGVGGGCGSGNQSAPVTDAASWRPCIQVILYPGKSSSVRDREMSEDSHPTSLCGRLCHGDVVVL